MFFRAVSVFIVLFWATMTALLLRNEVQPGDSALREVPFGHVVKLLFHHHPTSDLNISNDRRRLGHLRIAPRIDKATGLRVLTFNGNMHFPVPGAKSQRVTWDGELEMDKALAVRRLRFGLRVQEPTDLRSEIVVIPDDNIAHFELRSPTGVLERQSYSLDQRGAQAVLQQFGIDPAMLPAQMRQAAPPVIKAKQSSLKVHGERMDTYLVTVQANGQTWLEFHVDQLGHIVRATTLLGYSFTPDAE